MSYRNGINYLSSKTRVLELCNQLGGRVAVCPEWNGRVMTSSCDGLDGSSFGLINVKTIDSLELDRGGRLCGGEDQLSLSPETGPLSVHYSPDERFFVSNPAQLPAGFQEEAFKIDSLPQSPEVRMRRNVRMTNRAGTRFDLDIVRNVRLLDIDDIRQLFGSAVSVSLEQPDVSYVGFSTFNLLINRGLAHSKSSGLVSVRVRGMFNSSPHCIAVVPFRVGDADVLGPPVCADFFGSSPHGRLRLLPEAALLRADSKYRCQIGVSRRRAVGPIGSVDFRDGILTLIAFDMPKSPWEHDYPSNAYCETTDGGGPDFVNVREYRQEAGRSDAELYSDLYSGEVVRAYNHGPTHPGAPATGQFYEFDVFSPARELLKGDSLTHHQYTLHVNADNQTLAYLLRSVFGIDYDRIYEKMML